MIGHDARAKAQRVCQTLLTRWERMVRERGHKPFTDSRIELIGGDFEVSCRLSVRHADRKALQPLVRESSTAAVSMAQGGWVSPGTVSNVVSAFMLLKNKSEVPCSVDCGDGPMVCTVDTQGGFQETASTHVKPVEAAKPPVGCLVKTKLRQLCWARSGDKGDAANIGLIARRPEFLPVLRHSVTTERVRMYFQPDCKGRVERFDLPGISAMNFLLHNTLGGGGSSSLHADPLAKTYGQRLLEMEIEAPAEWSVASTSRL